MAAGIVKELDSSNRSYYKADDIVKLLDVSQSKAYNMIREMRQECIDNGKLTKANPNGRIPKKYFDEICMIE